MTKFFFKCLVNSQTLGHGLKSMVTTWVEPLALDYLKYDGSQEHMCRSAELKILL